MRWHKKCQRYDFCVSVKYDKFPLKKHNKHKIDSFLFLAISWNILCYRYKQYQQEIEQCCSYPDINARWSLKHNDTNTTNLIKILFHTRNMFREKWNLAFDILKVLLNLNVSCNHLTLKVRNRKLPITLYFTFVHDYFGISIQKGDI